MGKVYLREQYDSSGGISWKIEGESQDFWTAEKVQFFFDEIHKATTKGQVGKIRDTLIAYIELDKLTPETRGYSLVVALFYELIHQGNLKHENYQEVGKAIRKHNRKVTSSNSYKEIGIFPDYQWKKYKGLETKKLLIGYFVHYVINDFTYDDPTNPSPPVTVKSKLKGTSFTIEGVKYIYDKTLNEYIEE